MQISHTEAHRLIQLDLDHSLSHDDTDILHIHLSGCQECRRYAAGMKEMESLLTPLMRRQWNLSPAPLSSHIFKVEKPQSQSGSPLLVTRTALIGLVCMIFLFGIWQFRLSGGPSSGAFTAAVPLIPTPSIQYTLTNATENHCEQKSYTVQERDTLDILAQRFGTSKQEIMIANHMTSAILRPSTTIWIPDCALTPTGTINASTTTYTPSLNSFTSTPGG